MTIGRWREAWERYHLWLGAILTAVLILICYGFALRLPFFFDDLPIMTWLRRHSWLDIWTTSSDGDFFRPLTFSLYKAGRLFPPGVRQVVLHSTSLILYWSSSLLVMRIARLSDRDRAEALLVGVLFVLFPFMSTAVPWITAMPHLLVTTLTALGVFAALKAERNQRSGWWWISLAAMILAPTAHESGVVCAAIVGGVVVIQRGLPAGRGVIAIILGHLVSLVAVVLRGWVPGVREASFVGLRDALRNVVFFLHGLVYPVAPVIGRLVRQRGAHDFTLVILSSVGFFAVVVWAMRHRRDWRYAVSSAWWWACAVLPAVASLRYGYLYTSPRIHALSAGGLVMLWGGLIAALGRSVRDKRGRGLVWVVLVGLIVTQNLAFLRRQRSLYGLISGVYQQVLSAAEDERHAPLGFVNLPRGVGRRERTYAMTHETVMFVPPYSDIAEFIEVNGSWRPAEAVMYSPVLQEPDIAFSFQGPGLTWEEMREFAVDRRTVWLSEWRNGRFTLRHVGTVEADAGGSDGEPLVAFEDGPRIASASVEPIGDGRWAVAIDWAATGPVDAQIFVHVRDVDGNLVTQADGPVLGGMVPPWIWQGGDRIHDVRQVAVPDAAADTYLVHIGLFDEEGRYPAYRRGARCPQDACSVATVVP